VRVPKHSVVAFLFFLAPSLTACHYFPDHYLIYPRHVPDDVITWSQAIAREQLLVQLEGARPPGSGPFPTVLVHPEGGKTAADMKGIIWDLAGRGYVAIAADYQRCGDGACEPNLFAWRSSSDATAVVDLTKDYAVVDQTRIGLLGFSQGGVLSLLIAAYAPDRIRAVVSYYPVTDFVYWLREDRSGWWQRRIYGVVRWYFRRQSGAVNEPDFTEMLRRASPYYVADAIQAPVLLVHGERDTTAPVEESERMAERLRALGKEADLLVIPGAVHIFNFRQQREAASAWQATVEWLDRHLRVAPS
jgi:dipeptidyl aminopeptidase/acylaminoacyl peptidase